ncbi:MAG: hypothetical protein HY391_00595 [Deltaproteobacteria bacterium]|nr:hypothetical protein [Deltaproteobacteria bacterium]
MEKFRAKRLIQQEIQDPLSRMKISREVLAGSFVVADVGSDGKMSLSVQEPLRAAV